MTDNNQTTPITLDDLKYVWTTSGLPCFYADRPGIEEIIEGLGFSIYYLMCNVAVDKTIPAKTTTTAGYGAQPQAQPIVITEMTTSIVKVVSNIIGRSVSVVEDHILELDAVRESAVYNMPPIPKVIIEKLDEFFRLVDARHGTESIVILTFDPSKNDSSGWGVLVPDQTNTSVHCKYDPDSIVEQKPDHVMIVGSVHSHPNMAAYASGTDHADQADFDGLHITYGWQKTVNGGATQYHIEMQMAGTSWTLKPEDVFEHFTIKKDPDPDVVEWADKVKKAYPPLSTQAGVTTTAATTQIHSLGQTQTPVLRASTTTGSNYSYFQPDTSYQQLPKVNTPLDYLIVAEIDPAVATDSYCPSCRYELSKYDLEVGYCNICDVALVSYIDDIDSIFAHANWYLINRGRREHVAIYLWTTDENDGDTILKLGELTPSDNFSSMSYDRTGKGEIVELSSLASKSYDRDIKYDRINNAVSLEEEDRFEFSEDLTICCMTSSNLSDCQCDEPLFYDDLTDFRNSHQEVDFYDYNSNCFYCKFIETSSCKPFIEAVATFVRTRQLIETPITDCDNFVHYTSYETPVSVSPYQGNNSDSGLHD